MYISLTNTIGALQRRVSSAASIITQNLQLWLDFEKSEVVGGELVVKDKSTNTNNAKLFTGKALSFNGNDAVTDFGNPNVNLKSICFWVNLDTTTEQLFNLTSTQSIEVVSGVITLNGTWSNSNIYVDGVATTSIGTTPKRVVITTDTNILVDDLEFARIGTDYGSLDLADVQIYDAEFTLADALLDYNNPNHLIFDVGGSIALSNLKGYWALSEGAGSFAYNSAIALGSEEVVNGDFSNGSTDWDLRGFTTIINEVAGVDCPSTSYFLIQNSVMTAGLTYILTFDLTVDSGVMYNYSTYSPIQRSASGTYTETFVASSANLAFRSVGSFVGTMDNISVKEVSAGTISGATYVDKQPTIPQLGLMDWSKQNISGNEITLIQAPSNVGYDILGNPLRLRDHGFNLDGSGYAEVADDATLNISNGTIQFWLKTSQTKFNIIKGQGASKFIGQTDNGVWSFGNAGTITSYIDNATASTQPLYDDSWHFYTFTGVDLSTWTTHEISNLAGFEIDGIIDEVLIYNSVLSTSDIQNNYSVGLVEHSAISSYSDDYASDYGF